MMRTSLVVFSIFLISSVVLVSLTESSFADEILATNIGFENSTILELKNSRGNDASIDSVRIWVGSDNEFKSFKTEQGWIGKKQLNGVIEFTSERQINPGDSVKFGIKTTEKNPTINWKALDSDGELISSASTKILNSSGEQVDQGLNQSKTIAVKEESTFRFIPEKPNSNSEFRVVGENFVPNQNLDFYIGNEFFKSTKINEDGRILFTAKTPDIKSDERIEFVLRDSGGAEKVVSMRVQDVNSRDIPDLIKLSLGNTPKEVKLGEIISISGMATPSTTLTITSKQEDGTIVNINTIESGFDGKWTYEKLFPPDLDLGKISIEITDGKTSVLRNMEVISPNIIEIKTEFSSYEAGNTVFFTGKGIPNEEISVIIEDSIGSEIFSKTIDVDENGELSFEVEIPRGSIEGTYILTSYQGNERGITVFGIGQEPEEVLLVEPIKLNFASNENAKISIQGPTNAQVSIIVIDSADREKFSDVINLGPDGVEIYEIDTSEFPTGSFTINAKRGESSDSAIFTIGLSTGSGLIEVQSTKEEYMPGEITLILGNTGAVNVLLEVTITDSNGVVIKKVDTFSDKDGIFKIDNFRIPVEADPGEWKINVKSGGNFKETTFVVKSIEAEFKVKLDKADYRINEFVSISGSGAKMSGTVTVIISDSDGTEVDELNISAKGNGDFITVWKIPTYLIPGEYEITVDDGTSNTSIKFNIE